MTFSICFPQHITKTQLRYITGFQDHKVKPVLHPYITYSTTHANLEAYVDVKTNATFNLI